jgi:hypothetical protein
MLDLKRKWILTSLLVTPFFAQGFCDQGTAKSEIKPQLKPSLEAKAGYFNFTDSKMRKVYNRGGFDFQVSTSIPIAKRLEIYGSVEYLERHGRSLHEHEKTSIWEVPLSLGLKPVAVISPRVQAYITLGPRYVFLHQHNKSNFVDKNVSRSGFGGFANAGFNFFLRKHVFLDLFAEYSFVKMHVHPHKTNVYGRSTQVGGYVFGAGLGYAF